MLNSVGDKVKLLGYGQTPKVTVVQFDSPVGSKESTETAELLMPISSKISYSSFDLFPPSSEIILCSPKLATISAPPQGSPRASSSLRRRAANGGSQKSADSTTAAPSSTAAAQRHHRRRPLPSSPPDAASREPSPLPPAESGGSPAAFPITQQIRSPRRHCAPNQRAARVSPALAVGREDACLRVMGLRESERERQRGAERKPPKPLRGSARVLDS